MKIVILDAKTLGSDLDLSCFDVLGEVTVYEGTPEDKISERVSSCDVVVLNKIKFNENTVKHPENIRLVCITATGFDNVDLGFCRKNGIAVCNIVGYSTDSVAQVTLAMALSLKTHIAEYDNYSKSGEYTKSGVHNCLTPVYHELSSMTWGIVGYGNIGRRVAELADAFGCRIIVYKRTPVEGVECTDIDTLCRTADIISIHTPLNDGTKNLINRKRIGSMKNTAVLINSARGAVIDEEAVCDALLSGALGGFGTDVFSIEPYPEDHCYHKLCNYKNAIITPHMAWGAYESRERCISEVLKNIRAFENGENRNRVDI